MHNNIARSLSFKYLKNSELNIVREITEEVWYTTYLPILGMEQTEYMFQLIYDLKNLKEKNIAGEKFLLLESECIPAGFVSFIEYEKTVIKINKLYVSSKYQKRGFGKILIEKMKKIALNEGKSSLLLNVNRFNIALGFYEKLGFSVVKEEDIPIGIYFMNDFVLEMPLKNIDFKN